MLLINYFIMETSERVSSPTLAREARGKKKTYRVFRYLPNSAHCMGRGGGDRTDCALGRLRRLLCRLRRACCPAPPSAGLCDAPPQRGPPAATNSPQPRPAGGGGDFLVVIF